MKRTPPPTIPASGKLDHQWWSEWVSFVRDNPGMVDRVDGDPVYWGEHLFLGPETHKKLFRARRAVAVTTKTFADVIDYQDVADLRTWQETQPAPLLLHERILAEHCYICGSTGTGKTSLAIAPILIQLMRGAKTSSSELSLPYPIVILDFKGDSAFFYTVKAEAERRGQPFKFFSIGTKNGPTFRFNPFRGFERSSRTIAQFSQLILDALSLNHGKDYGRSYYTERSRYILSATLKRHENISSFQDLHDKLRTTVASMDARAKGDAFELLSVIEMLTEYRQLVTGVDDDLSNRDSIIYMPDVLRDRQVSYFWLPAALESISAGEIGKLVLFNLRTAAQDWKRHNRGNSRQVILVIDELQRVAGENLRGILQDARSFGISAILANQSLKDLKTKAGFDLAPTIMTNTRVKFFFAAPSEKNCYVYVERAKGFTEARQYPQLGNPWLKDLSPEEFAYNVRLTWPITREKFDEWDDAPLPDWGKIPGGDWTKQSQEVLTANSMDEDSDSPSDNFAFTRDDEWEVQVNSIRALFNEDERLETQDSAIDSLFGDEEQDEEEALDFS